MPYLANRRRQPELMDQPDLDEASHRGALDGLARVNRFSRSSAIVWPPIKRLGRRVSNRPLRVLDVACGGGDVPIDIKRRAERARIPIDVAGCDISPLALSVAATRAKKKGLDVSFFETDAISATLPADYDVVMCSLFLHHLDQQDAIGLLMQMGQAARRLVLVQDLLRSNLGYLLAVIGTRLLTRSHVVHVDGPLSVQSAFIVEEVADLAGAAGLHGVRFTRHWPQRFLLHYMQRTN